MVALAGCARFPSIFHFLGGAYICGLALGSFRCFLYFFTHAFPLISKVHWEPEFPFRLHLDCSHPVEDSVFLLAGILEKDRHCGQFAKKRDPFGK
ncbi:hypothetical protein LINGRAHAP2_LOCUS23081 [Linum grandiflorum]